MLTSRDLPILEGAKITFTATSTGDAIRRYAGGTDMRVWIVGGGEVITDGLDQGAIVVLEIYVIPTVLGTGVPLFSRTLGTHLDLIESRAFSNGVMKLIYSPS